MKFTACKHLSFDQKKFSCELVQVANHLAWERRDPDGKLQLCQQCTLRGRINSVQGCIGKKELNATNTKIKSLRLTDKSLV